MILIPDSYYDIIFFIYFTKSDDADRPRRFVGSILTQGGVFLCHFHSSCN